MQDKELYFSLRGIEFPVLIDENYDIISKTIENTGVWEDNQLQYYLIVIPEDGIFIDVGANVGINSLFAKASRPSARVISVEPKPRNFRRLQLNTNGCDIELYNLAIADQKGTIGFAGTGTNAHIASGGEHDVQCDMLDAFTAGLDVERIDLLKIDVEGFTDLVLSRSEQTLRRTKVSIIEFSHGDILSRLRTMDRPESEALEHSEELFSVLRPHFSHFYYISRQDGLVELDRTAYLFPLMFSEAVVGDILASKTPLPAISSVAFAFRSINELKRQNHLRIVEIQELRKSWS